jgi:hypothetical protein
MNYKEFLSNKEKTIAAQGINVNESQLNSNLFDFQKIIVQKALQKGRFAIFADCGLGKTFMQLEWANQVYKNTQKPVLIIAPLAVNKQTIEEGERWGITVKNAFSDQFAPIQIINYEQLDNIDCGLYEGVVLDESSILKNYEGKIKTTLVEKFKDTPYKLACTATPSPNDPMELGNHSEFLGYMTRSVMLAMYFIHDGSDTSKWRIKGHAVKKFYNFVSQWAVMIASPSDIGFASEKYILPTLNYVNKVIKTPQRDNGLLFNETAINATNFNNELRLTKIDRLEMAADIVNKSNDPFIIWIKQNEEGELLKKLIPDAVEVKGSDSNEVKEKNLLGFAKNEFRVLITKAKIAQYGLNYQNCNNQIFASLDFSFEALYQAIRRSYRFGQKRPVNIYIITTDTMSNVLSSIQNKQLNFEKMQKEMKSNIVFDQNKNKDVFCNHTIQNDYYTIKRGDSCQLIKEIPDESVDFSIFSPPFSSLYTYSDHIEDMGNSKNDDEFYIHFGFLVEDIYRIIKPGRNVSVHCMNLPTLKSKDGFIGIKDFRGELIRLFLEKGFIYHSEVTIWKDPVVAMQRTKAIGLLHKQMVKDSTISRQGIPDYLVTFRKPGVNANPVCGELDHWAGDDSFKQSGNLSIDLWQRYASPVWMDINQSNTLQYMAAKQNQDERHIAPLQLDVIHRALQLWTNKGDTVFTPFLGIGSEMYESILLERKGIGFELKESYLKKQCKQNYSDYERGSKTSNRNRADT